MRAGAAFPHPVAQPASAPSPLFRLVRAAPPPSRNFHIHRSAAALPAEGAWLGSQRRIVTDGAYVWRRFLDLLKGRHRNSKRAATTSTAEADQKVIGNGLFKAELPKPLSRDVVSGDRGAGLVLRRPEVGYVIATTTACPCEVRLRDEREEPRRLTVERLEDRHVPVVEDLPDPPPDGVMRLRQLLRHAEMVSDALPELLRLPNIDRPPWISLQVRPAWVPSEIGDPASLPFRVSSLRYRGADGGFHFGQRSARHAHKVARLARAASAGADPGGDDRDSDLERDRSRTVILPGLQFVTFGRRSEPACSTHHDTSPGHPGQRPLADGVARRLLTAENMPRHQEQDMSNKEERIIRLRTVLERTGLSRSTLYRKIGEGTFPRQIRIAARCAGWRESAVEAWLRNPMFFTVDDHP
jgi:prophage regulatory protein